MIFSKLPVKGGICVSRFLEDNHNHLHLRCRLKCGLPIFCSAIFLSFRQIDLSPLAAPGRTPAKMAAPQSDCSLYRARATNEKIWLSSYLNTAKLSDFNGYFLGDEIHTSCTVPKTIHQTNTNSLIFFSGWIHLPAELPAHCSCGDCNIHEELGKRKKESGKMPLQSHTRWYKWGKPDREITEITTCVASIAIMMAPHAAHTNVTKTKLSFVAALTIEILIIFCNLMIC